MIKGAKESERVVDAIADKFSAPTTRTTARGDVATVFRERRRWRDRHFSNCDNVVWRNTRNGPWTVAQRRPASQSETGWRR